MPRKRPSSTKAKRQTLPEHRQRVRDLQVDVIETTPRLCPRPRNRESNASTVRTRTAVAGIESRFLKVDKATAEHLRLVYSQRQLVRPIDPRLAITQPEDIDAHLTVPKRPKWRYDATKKEVEANEAGQHAKWLRDLDAAVAARETATPTYIERNLDVWRQLWRVTEISEILICLLDVRFPLLHYPTSLRLFLRSLRPRKEVILVLSKCDLVPAELAERWRRWLQAREDAEVDGATSVVCVEAYREQARVADAQGSTRLRPGTSDQHRRALIEAIEDAHTRLCTPPKTISADPARLAVWKPPVRPDIDWERLKLDAEHQQAPVQDSVESLSLKIADSRLLGGRESRKAMEDSSNRTQGRHRQDSLREADNHEQRTMTGDTPYLTLGFLGSPNAGKSSLINALFGRKMVRASRTAGATKRLQTHFLLPEVRLSDCPGLVWPSKTSMQAQILAGVLPLQHAEISLSYVADRLPLERLVRLSAGDTPEAPAPVPDPMRLGNLLKERQWTTDDLLTSVALRESFLTAKAGRPDVARAGVKILRQLHAGSIRWGFRPPDGVMDDIVDGIALGGEIKEQDEQAQTDREDADPATATDSETSEASSEGEPPAVARATFAALEVENGSD